MWWMQRWTFLRLCRWWEPHTQSRECGPENAKWLQNTEWFHLQLSSAHHMFILVKQLRQTHPWGQGEHEDNLFARVVPIMFGVQL